MTTKNNIEQLFKNQSNWDLVTPNANHEKRFLNKLKKKKAKKKPKKNWIPLSIAASLLLVFSVLYFINSNEKQNEVVFSPQVQQTHDYFSSVLNAELKTLKNQENPQNKILIKDALLQMQSLENDYNKLKNEIAKNGENKQIVYAMITNMQTRIDFIKSVLDRVETINKLNTTQDENHI